MITLCDSAAAYREEFARVVPHAHRQMAAHTTVSAFHVARDSRSFRGLMPLLISYSLLLICNDIRCKRVVFF